MYVLFGDGRKGLEASSAYSSVLRLEASMYVTLNPKPFKF